MSADTDDPLKDTQTLPTAPTDGTAEPTDSPYLIVLRGLRVGEMFRINTRITIGRDDGADVRMSDAGVSRAHARILTRPDGVIYLVDLESSNGTFVNGERITGPTFLADGDKIGVGFTSILKFTYSEQLEKLFPVCRATDRPHAMALGERLPALVADDPFFVPSLLERVPSVPVTISVGVAVYPDPGLGTPGQLLAAADRALFAAKSSGPNVVRLASSQPPG
jgi:FHA domain